METRLAGIFGTIQGATRLGSARSFDCVAPRLRSRFACLHCTHAQAFFVISGTCSIIIEQTKQWLSGFSARAHFKAEVEMFAHATRMSKIDSAKVKAPAA